MLKIYYTETSVTITGDEAILEKAQKGTGAIDPALLDISDVRINADSLEKLFLKAESTGPIVDENGELVGYPHAKRYVALREKFLAMVEAQRPVVEELPSVEEVEVDATMITTQSIKPINA